MDSRKPHHLTWHTAEVQGRAASYGDAGPADGPPLVFLHGWGLGDKSYKRALNRLARHGLRVLAPALPGFGGTAGLPREDHSMLGYARWVIDFCDTVGVTDPIRLVGHSFGGGVAIKTAHTHPDRIALLVLVNSVGGSVWKKRGEQSRHIEKRPVWDWGIHFPLDMAPKFSKIAPVIAEDVIRNVLRNPLGFWHAGMLAKNADLRAELEDLKAGELPVVVLWSTEDRILPSAGLDDIVEAIGIEPAVVDGSHSWMLADPDAFGEVMTNIVSVADLAARGDLESEETA
ncbi:MAG: alpha/beta fold hydrolase [Acidimicrobiia bacterium]|nr:alpha/beta fold hydrolase [Acidimicrobiia bacterium]